MLTGRQMRKARKLLRWSRIKFSRNILLSPALVEAVESSDGAAWLTDEQEACIRRVCAEAGIRFDIDAEGQPGAVLAKAVP
ncbi:MAG: hypothetical protein ACRYGP_08155 [Janthinobacterium lividum]